MVDAENIMETEAAPVVEKKPSRPPWDPEPTPEEKAVAALNIVCRNQFAEFDPKADEFVFTRFCAFNIAFFDLDKESPDVDAPPFDESTKDSMLEDSINIVTLKVLESDLGYPINVFGTVLVRDNVDYRCIYIFRRDRDSAQRITSPEETLTLTGPHRGISVTDSIFFEINIKARRDFETADRDFSKGVLEHRGTMCYRPLGTLTLSSWLSTVQLVYTPVLSAVAATLQVIVLEGPSKFFAGTITACTTRNPNPIVLYDSGAPGARTWVDDDGVVHLSCGVVAVPRYQELVLKICIPNGSREAGGLTVERTLGHMDREFVIQRRPHKLRVKVEWSGVLRSSRHNVWEFVGTKRILKP